MTRRYILSKVEETKRKIEACREELNQELGAGKTFADIYTASIKLDELIEDYLNLVKE